MLYSIFNWIDRMNSKQLAFSLNILLILGLLCFLVESDQNSVEVEHLEKLISTTNDIQRILNVFFGNISAVESQENSKQNDGIDWSIRLPKRWKIWMSTYSKEWAETKTQKQRWKVHKSDQRHVRVNQKNTGSLCCIDGMPSSIFKQSFFSPWKLFFRLFN